MQMISIIIPVYNESEILQQSLLKLHQYLSQKNRPFEIITVNNGSVDDTQTKALQMEKKINNYRALDIPEKSVGKAFAKGVREARYDFVISLDADLSVDLAFIDYAEGLLPFADMIVGSKTLGQQKRSWVRVLGSQLYLMVTQILFHMTITDFSMGAKAFRRQSILPILDYIDSWTAYVFEICTWLIKNKKTVLQIGVQCNDQRPSHFNIWHEGLYRYWNLYRVWKELKQEDSWFNRIQSN
jgi:glycosyltransferase involved in cell wall biosynthesis